MGTSHPATTTATTKDIYFPYLIPARLKVIYFSSEHHVAGLKELRNIATPLGDLPVL